MTCKSCGCWFNIVWGKRQVVFVLCITVWVNYIVFVFLILRMMGTFFKGDKGKGYLKISNYYLYFARFRMETEEDENINKPRQIDNLTQQATCENEVRPLKCSFCDRHFAKEAVCRQHELIHNGEKPYQCRYCDKCFNRSSTRNRHEVIHTGVKPHKCNYCDKFFRLSSDCNLHELIHSGGKPHKCKYCDKFFCLSSLRNQHELTHSGVKPHKCNYCDMFFRMPAHRN